MNAIYLAPLVLLAAGCQTIHRHHPERVVTVRTRTPPPEERCTEHHASIETAASGPLAITAVEGYLSCVATWSDAPPLDLEARVTSALAVNPYPQTRRQAARIRARFFDPELMQSLPQTRRGLERYLELLDAQILRLNAEKKPAIAKAAKARAQRLRKLVKVLDTLEEKS